MAAIPQPVKVETGLMSGVAGRDSSITVYKGVPFAAAPVADLRWRPPQPPLPWQGVRKSDRFGNVCPQVMRAAAAPVSEDWLGDQLRV